MFVRVTVREAEDIESEREVVRVPNEGVLV